MGLKNATFKCQKPPIIDGWNVHIVLIDLLRKKLINKNQAIKSLEILDKEGRYSSDIALHYYKKINEV